MSIAFQVCEGKISPIHAHTGAALKGRIVAVTPKRSRRREPSVVEHSTDTVGVGTYCANSLSRSIDRLYLQLKYYQTEMRREKHFVPESCRNFELWLDQQLDWFSAGLESLAPGLSEVFRQKCLPIVEMILGTLQKLRADIRGRFL